MLAGHTTHALVWVAVLCSGGTVQAPNESNLFVIFMAGDNHIDCRDSTIISLDFFRDALLAPKDVSGEHRQKDVCKRCKIPQILLCRHKIFSKMIT